ncbi:MAG TPA: DUF222 domain-containing protein [Ilumatobacter sp.]|nr:DUF222 domain-containing protein [Ilumatobacter sp.]
MPAVVGVTLPTEDEIASLSGREHDDVLAELERIGRKIHAAKLDVINHADREARFLADGHRNSAAWTRAVTNCSPSESRKRVRGARALRELAMFREALHVGSVGVDQLNEVARLHANPRCGREVAGSEQILLDAARQLEYQDFTVVTQRWLTLADPDGAHRDHAAADANRDFRIHEHGAGFVVAAQCGVLQGTAIREMVQRFVDAEFVTDWEAARAQHGEKIATHLLPRTASQRRFDAFFQMLELGATSTSDATLADPVVNVIVDLDTFEQHLRAELGGAPPTIDPATILDRRCETTDGLPVDPRDVVALAMVGQVRRIVLDATDVIVNAGRLTRLYRGPLRQALQALTPRCKWLGCLIRARIAAIDHRHDFADGGATDAANGDVMCNHHNFMKSKRGYRARRLPNGWWVIQRPDGTPLRPLDAA